MMLSSLTTSLRKSANDSVTISCWLVKSILVRIFFSDITGTMNVSKTMIDSIRFLSITSVVLSPSIEEHFAKFSSNIPKSFVDLY